MTYITTTPAAASRAAASPAGTTHGPATRRGQDHELGRMAQAYEDMHEPDFGREYSQALILGMWALAFIVSGAAFIAAPYVLRLLFALFELLAVS